MRRVFAVVALLACGLWAQGAGSITGWWEGTLAAQAALRMELHVTAAPSGYAATFKSLDQGGYVLAATSVSVSGDKVTILAASLHAGFSGTLSADGKTLTGRWSQGGGSLPLELHWAAGPLVTHHAQQPEPPFPYHIENVTVASVGGIQLAGTLTEPEGKGPFAAAILIAGSGPNDRDETVMGHKPFWVLADSLTRRGIAVLRLDKRGIGQSSGNAATATSSDYAADAEADLGFMEKRPEIDRKRIGLIGHSEGGIIAPMVASARPEVAYVVLMAGPGESGEALLVAQVEALNRAGGATPAQVAADGKLEKKLLDVDLATRDPAQLGARLNAVIAGGQLPAAQVAALAAPWMREFLRLDPVPYLEKLRCPVLALIGSKDLQVPAGENLPLLRRALAGDARAEVVEMPGLNHLFQTATTGLPSEYAEIEETIAPAALEKIGSWVSAQTATREPGSASR